VKTQISPILDSTDLIQADQQDPLARLLLVYEVEQFFYYEAELLDSWQFEEWFNLLADDLEYRVPVRTTLMTNDVNDEFSRPGEGAFFDDTKAMLEQRVKKLRTGFAWSEDPHSRTRHLLSNIKIKAIRPDVEEVDTESNMLLFRSRLENTEDQWFGRRLDTIRKSNGQWKLARRTVLLDHTLLKSQNISIFF